MLLLKSILMFPKPVPWSQVPSCTNTMADLTLNRFFWARHIITCLNQIKLNGDYTVYVSLILLD